MTAESVDRDGEEDERKELNADVHAQDCEGPAIHSQGLYSMNVEGVARILSVSSLEDSCGWLEKLAWEKRWDYGDPPDFGAVGNGMFEIFLCLDCQGCRANDDDNDGGTWMSWFVASPAEVDAAYALALQNGLIVTEPPTDKPWNLRECHIRHPDGHTFRIGAAIGEERDVPTEVRKAGAQ